MFKMIFKIHPRGELEHADIYSNSELVINCVYGLLSYDSLDGSFWKDYGHHIIRSATRYDQITRWRQFIAQLDTTPDEYAKDIVLKYTDRCNIEHFDVDPHELNHYTIDDYIVAYLKTKSVISNRIKLLRKMIQTHNIQIVHIYIKSSSEDMSNAIINMLTV